MPFGDSDLALISSDWKAKLNWAIFNLGLGGLKGNRAMLKRLLLAAVLAALATGPAKAEDRVTLGWGRLFSNDQLGDGRDRWRSGAYSVSRVRGPSWAGQLPGSFGEILEFRGHSSIITPSSLQRPAATDRRYAGLLSFGLHSHFAWKGAEMALGGDLVFSGPQTGVGGFQNWMHERLGMEGASTAVLDDQIGNAVYPTLVGEMGRSFALGSAVQARPFVEARAGVETLLRIGGDITIGDLGRDDLMLRDVTTGQRYRAVEGDRDNGISLTMGGDLAQVFDSALLPDGGAATLSDQRYRLRAGLHWQGKKAAGFYGVSYLSPEFEEQPQGQFVGALSLNLRF